MDKGRGLRTAGRAGLFASVLCLLSFVLPFAAQAASSDYSGWRKSDGTPQSVMLSYYDGPDTRGFAWQTSTSVSSGALWLLKGEWDSSTGNFDTNQVATATRVSGDSCYCYKAYATGLATGTWSYRLGAASHYAYGKFVVRDGTAPFVAVNITDIQLKSADKLSNWKNVVKAADAVLSGGANADTIISCGDFIDQTNPSGYNRYVCWGVTADQARPEFADVAWTMAGGNHDNDTTKTYCKDCCAENYDSSAASNGGGCHSYNYGKVHVATIPYASSLSSGVENWLTKDLAAAQDAQWRILVMHFGPYTTGDHGFSANTTYIQKVSGLCATYKVDLVLQGHDHTYSKTLPYHWTGNGYTKTENDSVAVNLKPATVVIGGETYYDKPEGTVYVSAGCAGDRVGEQNQSPYYYAVRGKSTKSYDKREYKIVTDTVNVKSTYANVGDDGSADVGKPMFAVLTVDDSTLKYDWYVAASSTPELFDTLRISKAPPEPPHDEDEAITVAQDGTKTITTIASQASWSYEVTSGDDRVKVDWAMNPDGTATFTFTGVEAGTATVVIYQEDSTTPLKTVTVTVLPPDPMTTPIRTTFNGKVVTTIGAVINAMDPSGDLILIYTNTAAQGSLTLEQDESARVLVIGGGGAGVAGSSSMSKKYGTGGNGGQGTDSDNVALPTGTYSITVGTGGTSSGAGGSKSSLSGGGSFTPIEGKGASLQTDTTHSTAVAGTDGFSANGGMSDITGTSKRYGAGGAKATTSAYGTSGEPGTGNGGVGGYGSGSAGGAGASGIVVVRLKFSEPPVDKDEAITLSVDEAKTITTIAAQATWSYAVTDGADLVAVSCVTNDDNTATFTFTGVEAGTAKVVIYQEDGETPLKTVTVNVLPPDPMTTPIKTKLEGRVFTSLGAIVDSTMAPGELIFVYTNTAAPGSLEVPEDATARILVVGGGGGGASGKKGTNRYYGDGGSGGQGVDTSVTLPVGTYAITVGAGGAGISGGTSDPEIKQGEDGRASKFAAASGASGFEPLDGAGGAKGGNTSHKNANSSSGSAGFGESDITGTTVTYGAAGAGVTYARTDAEGQKPGTDGDAGTGAGGGGAGCNSMSGAGGSGIVIVRITGFVEVTPPEPPPVDPPAGPAEFCVTPYLQRPAPDAMTIVFFTDRACGATVTCGAQTTNTVGVWAQALTNNLVCKESSAWNNSLYKHSVRFTGLEPNGNYEYAVTLDGGASYTNAFHTAPDRNTPIRFVSYADCETESDPRANYVKNLAQMKSREPDFIAIPGDFTARGGIQSHWDGFWKANAGEKGEIAGSIPLLTVLGNHDLYDNGVKGDSASDYKYDLQGETGTERYLAYFENEPNGVEYKFRDGTEIPETRDLSQLFHRVDYGPVTLIFLDTNDGDNNDPNKDTNYETRSGNYCPPGIDRSLGGRHPDFNPGSPQYTWLTNQLADAQQKSRFTFVFNHHCPYSRGGHNQSPTSGLTGGSAQPVRILTETMVRYGVDGWYCGHDELLEHSITNGWEILPDGSRRKHTLSIYDLGCSGDSPRDSDVCKNPLEYWWSSDNYGGAGGYGFLETDVTTNRNGQWTCTITPIQGSTGKPLSAQVVYVENQERGEDANDLVYAEAANATHPIDGASQTKPSDWLPLRPSSDPEDPPDEPTPFELLCAAATAGEAYVIEDDMEFPAGGVLTVPAGAEFVLDLKGHAITCHADGAIVNHGTLTILDSAKASPLAAHLTYSAAELGKGYSLVRSDGELTVDGVFVDAGFVNDADSEFGGGNTAIAATAGKMAVKNGAHVGGRTALDAAGNVAVEIRDSHVAGWRGAAIALAGASSTLSVSNSTLEAEGRIVRATAGSATIVDSVLATSRTTAPFDLASGSSATVEKTIYVDRMAKWFPVTTALANAGADLKVGAGCLLAVASANVIGFLDEGVTAAEVAARVWRTKGADEEALPPLTPEEEARIAEVLSSSPDALLKANVTTIEDYTAYKAWVDGKVREGGVESEAAAKGAAGSFFSFATDQGRIVDPVEISEEKVKVEEMKVDGGEVKLTVGIEDLPVGENAQRKYLEQVFGVTGTGSLEKNDFAAEKVVYKQDMVRNADGTVSYTVEPKTENGEAKPAAFFFKASVAK